MSVSERPGWHDTSDKKSSKVVCFRELQAELDTLSFLKQWEIARFYRPQGPLDPLDPACINSDLIQKLDKIPARHIHKTLEAHARSLGGLAEAELPAPTPPSFWHALEAAGGEEAADRAGVLVYRMKLEVNTNQVPLLTLASPVIGSSRRLFRKHEARRILRITLDDASERLLQRNNENNIERTRFKQFISRPLRHLGTYYRCFYYQKGALYFWGVDHCFLKPEWFPPISISEFLEDKIPRSDGRNDTMSLAKYSARMSLWLSKTQPIVCVEDVRWVPDLTNHTIPIGSRMLEKIALELLGLDYVPSCLAGTCRGRSYVWAARPGIEKRKIGIYQEDEETRELYDGQPYVFTFRAFRGHAHEEITKELRIEENKLQEYVIPKHPVEIMTDGNAYMSYGLGLAVCEARNMDAVPAAVQARIGGSKGLWTLQPDPDTEDTSIWIEVRESQHKYIEADNCDWTFEFLNCSGPAKPASIGPQLLGVLARTQSPTANSKLLKYLSGLLDQDVKNTCISVLDISDRAMMRKAVERADRNHQGREVEQKREGAHMHFGNSGEEEDADLRYQVRRDWAGRHPISGRPHSWGAEACELIGAGFELDDPALLALLQRLLRYDIEMNIGSPRIAVPRSRVLYVATDPTGLLEEGEVFIQLSEGSLIDERSKLRKSAILSGPVLITRPPCIQPTDIQKVTAVDVPELRQYFDICICSVEGSQSLLSLLSGGDYDGDTCTIIFDDTITSRWTNVDKKPFIDNSESEAQYWQSITHHVGATAVKDVGEMEDALSNLQIEEDASCVYESEAEKVEALRFKRQEALDACLCKIMLAPLYVENHFGVLANRHKELLRKLGPRHWKTILVGRLHCQALDAGKAGKVFKPGQLNRALQVRNEHQDNLEQQNDVDLYDRGPLHQPTGSSPSKRAAAKLGDMSIDEDASDAGESDESDTESSHKGIRHERLLSIEAELSRTRAGTVYRGGSPEEARAEDDDDDDEEEEGSMNKDRFDKITKEDVDTGETMDEAEQLGQHRLLLDDAHSRSRSNALVEKLGKDRRKLDDADIKGVWLAYTKAPQSKRTLQYLDEMRKHVETQAQSYKIWKTTLARPQYDRPVGSKEQELQAQRKARVAEQQAREHEDIVRSFWNFEHDREAIHPDLFHHLMASCAYYTATKDIALSEFPFLVAFRYVINIKADAVEKRSAAAGLPALKVIGEVLDTLQSRMKLPKVPLSTNGDQQIKDMLNDDDAEEGSPQKKRRTGH